MPWGLYMLINDVINFIQDFTDMFLTKYTQIIGSGYRLELNVWKDITSSQGSNSQ